MKYSSRESVGCSQMTDMKTLPNECFNQLIDLDSGKAPEVAELWEVEPARDMPVRQRHALETTICDSLYFSS